MFSSKPIVIFFIVAFMSVQAATNPNATTFTTSGLQWPDAAFSSLIKNVTKALYSTDKLEAIKAGISSSPFGLTGNQITQLYDFFFRSSDVLALTQIIQNNTYGLTCQQLAYILKKVSFSTDKLDVIKSLAPYISDRVNNKTILDFFYSSSDKNQASQYIASSLVQVQAATTSNVTNITNITNVTTSVLQWPDAAFSNLIKNVTKALSSTYKLQAIKAGISNSHFSFAGDQVTKLYDFFFGSSDVLALTQIIRNNTYELTCQQLVYILKKVSFSTDKLDVLRSLAPYISDRANNKTILSLFYSSDDKNKASQYIATSKS